MLPRQSSGLLLTICRRSYIPLPMNQMKFESLGPTPDFIWPIDNRNRSDTYRSFHWVTVTIRPVRASLPLLIGFPLKRTICDCVLTWIFMQLSNNKQHFTFFTLWPHTSVYLPWWLILSCLKVLKEDNSASKMHNVRRNRHFRLKTLRKDLSCREFFFVDLATMSIALVALQEIRA